MYTWFNQSHPQTLQAAVILGYLTGIFSLLFGSPGRFGTGMDLLVSIGLFGGAFGVANSKRVGYYVLGAAATIRGLLFLDTFIRPFDSRIMDALGFMDTLIIRLEILNSMVFPAALVVAIFHSHTRNYQKVWFE